jgi:hypothetical protein
MSWSKAELQKELAALEAKPKQGSGCPPKNKHSSITGVTPLAAPTKKAGQKTVSASSKHAWDGGEEDELDEDDDDDGMPAGIASMP